MFTIRCIYLFSLNKVLDSRCICRLLPSMFTIFTSSLTISFRLTRRVFLLRSTRLFSFLLAALSSWRLLLLSITASLLLSERQFAGFLSLRWSRISLSIFFLTALSTLWMVLFFFFFQSFKCVWRRQYLILINFFLLYGIFGSLSFLFVNWFLSLFYDFLAKVWVVVSIIFWGCSLIIAFFLNDKWGWQLRFLLWYWIRRHS